MLVVLTHPRDPGGRQLVERWRPHGGRALGVRDLSAPGWNHGTGEAGSAVVEGARVAAADIRGVVTRIPHVRAGDLPHIVAEDREYVAAELTAFLTAWLDALPCPVLNRPSAASLMGPALSPERWLFLAARIGLPLSTRRYTAPDPEPLPATWIATVVGDRWFGDVAPELGDQAVHLARAAGVEVLTVRFADSPVRGAFASADPTVEITPEIADALRARIAALAGVRS